MLKIQKVNKVMLPTNIKKIFKKVFNVFKLGHNYYQLLQFTKTSCISSDKMKLIATTSCFLSGEIKCRKIKHSILKNLQKHLPTKIKESPSNLIKLS